MVLRCTTLTRLAAAAFAASTVVAGPLSSEIALAGYKYCAFRSGPGGPCTCKSDSDSAGQFTTVSRSRCKRTDKKQDSDAAATAGQPPAAPVQVEAAPVATPATPEPVAAVPAAGPAAAVAAETPAVPAPAAAPPANTATATTGPQVAASASPVDVGKKLSAVRARGKLLCGVNAGLAGFAKLSDSGDWSGLDADFCRAMAAAVFGDASKVEFVPLDAGSRFETLQSGNIDVLSRNTTWNMNRDVDLGLDFAGVLYLDGQSFMTANDRGLVSAQQLAGSKVCVESGTTSEKNLAYYFKAQGIEAQIVKFDARADLVKAYLAGECDAYTGDRSSLFADRAGFPDPLKHDILPEVISKEPLGPAVRDDDKVWSEINRWVLAALINAEEVGLDKAAAADASKPLNADAERLVTGAGISGAKLGLNATWLRQVVAASGNYGEIFEANLGKNSPIGMDRGLNALWNKGGLLYAPPMW